MKHHATILAAAMALVGGIAQGLPLSWGAASSFAVLGGSTVTSTGSTLVEGDLGLSPGTSVTGFNPPGIVTGEIHAGDATASQAHADAASAYAMLVLLAADTNLTGTDLGSRTLAPGVYRFDTSAQLTGDLVLDGAGDYIFLIGSTLTTATGSSIQAVNGASWMNVFFQVGSSATLGANTTFLGSILADTSVTLVSGTSVDGHVVGLNGSVTLDNNHVMIPEPSAAALMAAGLAVLLGRNRRPLRNPKEQHRVWPVFSPRIGSCRPAREA